jgi:hypothetical protein
MYVYVSVCFSLFHLLVFITLTLSCPELSEKQPTAGPASSSSSRAIALYDFNSSNKDELSFKARTHGHSPTARCSFLRISPTPKPHPPTPSFFLLCLHLSPPLLAHFDLSFSHFSGR